MSIKHLSFLLILMVLPHKSNSQSVTNLKEINTVWFAFYESFENLDYKLMASIHSKDLIRISGGSKIKDYKNCINSYKSRFTNDKKNNQTSEISLRFFERTHNDTIASERGIYKLIRNKNKNDEQTYYGQFHVILKKEQDIWKITMDYDSNEGNRIGEKQFLKAHGIADFHKYIEEKIK